MNYNDSARVSLGGRQFPEDLVEYMDGYTA
jgi:hypothetical protein